MRINPVSKEDIDKKAVAGQEKINRITRKAAVLLSFLIVYFFLIKLLFL